MASAAQDPKTDKQQCSHCHDVGAGNAGNATQAEHAAHGSQVGHAGHAGHGAHAGHHAHHGAAPPRRLDPSQPVEWTCPMHPEIVRDAPGSCPICGMALEPRTITAEEQENPELRDMTRRFWVAVVLTVPLLVLAMGRDARRRLARSACCRPARAPGSSCCWRRRSCCGAAGRSSCAAGSRSSTASLNMFTLIALGVAVA